MTTAPERKRILIVDDEPGIAVALETTFLTHGYYVRAANDGDSALQVFGHWRPHLVITDLAMPRMNGLALCRAIRAESDVPIIVLSVKGEESMKVNALESGADDYITKPFGVGEVLARVRAALRRMDAADRRLLLQLGDFVVDLDSRRVTVRGHDIAMSTKEFELLAYLMRNAEKIVTHRSLLHAIWGRGHDEHSDSVRVLVRQLRKKIEPSPASPRYLKSEPWVGYRFEPSGRS